MTQSSRGRGQKALGERRAAAAARVPTVYRLCHNLQSTVPDVLDSASSSSGVLMLPPTVKSGEPRRLGDSPYQRFQRATERQAACWRPQPTLTTAQARDPCLPGVSMQRRARVIANSIASEFVEWMRGLGSEERPSLSREDVLALFAVEPLQPVASGVADCLRELPSLPPAVAAEAGQPQKSTRRQLRQAVVRDARAQKRPPRLVVFGRCLPAPLRWRPPREDTAGGGGGTRRWLAPGPAPPRLASMAVVWDGITHLSSSRRFVQWVERRRRQEEAGLSVHAQPLPPAAPFLLQQGLQRRAPPPQPAGPQPPQLPLLLPARLSQRRHTLAAAFELLPPALEAEGEPDPAVLRHRCSVQH